MFKLSSKFNPSGDQPLAIKKLVKGIFSGEKKQTLLGVTGSGKTFTIANVIKNVQKPTLVIAPNKTLAAQLCSELREFFPENIVEYFVSYYDYYQPEAYMPTSDTYIEKEAQINDEIDRLRHLATQSLLSRKDVIIVASVSCIYSLGNPKEYKDSVLRLEKNQKIDRKNIIRQLIDMHFERTNAQVERGKFRATGDVIEIVPTSGKLSAQKNKDKSYIYRLILNGDLIEQIVALDSVTRKQIEEVNKMWIFPAKHYVVEKGVEENAYKEIEKELKDRLKQLKKDGKLLEYERLSRRTKYDLEMIKNIGYCNGIENYSRHFDGREPGQPPFTLLSFFPKGFLTIIDESHVTVPQIRAMHNGDRARKEVLVEHGFRLPSAKDNRPLTFDEFEKRTGQTIYVSATPSDFELQKSSSVVEQIVRPTGLIDPETVIMPVTGDGKYGGQVEDLMGRIIGRTEKNQRTLVTTLTKKMAEDLTKYLEEKGIKVQYIHSDVLTFKRIEILTDLRRGVYDVVVGVNLLREGLDLPEVSLVAILDADKEGFLRSETSLVQTIGRAARNIDGQVVLYADKMTGSLIRALKETDRRRKKQIAYNKKHGITPASIEKKITDISVIKQKNKKNKEKILSINLYADPEDLEEEISKKVKEMHKAALNFEYEKAADLRDEIAELRKELAIKYER